MKDESVETVQSSLFHRVQGSIFADGHYTYKVFAVRGVELEPGSIVDEIKLKKRLLDKIIKMNNERLRRYPIAEAKTIYENTPFRLCTFLTVHESGEGSGGSYAIYPLEFICDKCGKIYNVNRSDELSKIPTLCTSEGCGGKIEQNTIIMYCEECGTLDTMNCYCRRDNHGDHFAHIHRKSREDISTWEVYCSECKKNGAKSVDFMRYPCPKCKNKKKPLPVRDGGVVNPVILTFVDLESKPHGENSMCIRSAVDAGLITCDELKKRLNNHKATNDVYALIDQIISAAENPLFSENVKNAMLYIDSAISKIRLEYENVDFDELNDVQSILSKSISYDSYIKTLPLDESDMYTEWYVGVKKKFGIFDIRYIEDLKVVMSAIGNIVGINRFYEEDFVPHFVPYRNKKKDDEIYSIVYPTSTEGIMYRLDPIKVCEWLKQNGIIHIDTINRPEAVELLHHMAIDSDEYDAVKTLIHTISHILIKQSSIYTGLDEGTCAELLFPHDASILIYSTSNVNIGGFEYAFKYSIPNWFSRVMLAAEDCTLDPTCMQDGGKCFSCMYVAEFVCSNFNKQLSRQTLIGGELYKYGFWK